jgi:hypothetical protein
MWLFRRSRAGADPSSPEQGQGRALNSAVLGQAGEQLTQLFPAKVDDWSDANIRESLDRLFRHTVGAAQVRIAWYDARGSRTGRRSRLIRLCAIMCGTLGTIYPLVGAALKFPVPTTVADWNPSYIGYLLLGAAAALVAGDSAFGVSSSWMRFRATQVELEGMLSNFRYQWASLLAKANGQVPDATLRNELLALQQTFANRVLDVAQAETTAWMQEFRGALAELSRQYKGSTPARGGNVAGAQVNNIISIPDAGDEVERTASVTVTAPGGRAERNRKANGPAPPPVVRPTQVTVK